MFGWASFIGDIYAWNGVVKGNNNNGKKTK